MVDVNDIRDAAIARAGLSGLDRPFTFHYDETNNIRRLHLTPEGLNVRAPHCFVLGGVVHVGPAPALEFEDLRRAFALQKSSLELKLEQLGKGDFLALLDAPKVGTFLQWLTDAGAFVHFHVLDPLYWSLVDVIDSILDEHDSERLSMFGPMLKNDLYAVLRVDIAQTAEFLGRHAYPDVGPARRGAFIGELLELVQAREDRLPDFNFQMLKGVLQIATRLDRLPYLEDESPNILIAGFGAFYLHRLALFKHATHVLDIERTIKDYLASVAPNDGGTALANYRFVDSRTAPWVQVSDAFTGLLGKMFVFVGGHDRRAIIAALAGMNGRQRAALTVLNTLIERSIGECPAFSHHVLAVEDQERAAVILGFRGRGR
jgi:hypothetical protein